VDVSGDSVVGVSNVDSVWELYLDLLKACLTASLYDESAWIVLQSSVVDFGNPKQNRKAFHGPRIWLRGKLINGIVPNRKSGT
jgi:hypothetical protein